MELQPGFLNSRRLSLFSGIILAVAFGTFAYAQLKGFQRTHEWMLLLFCFSEMLTALFLLFRTDPETVSVNRFDWIVAIAGTFAPMLLRPASWGIAPYAKYAIAVGVMIQIAGLISLNRSIAIVAAKRKIKTEGLYRLVRHPLYAAYFLIFSGYVLMNTSLENLIIYVFTMALLFVRVFREEDHLSQDSTYREYMQTVSYRIIPFVF